VSIAIGLWVIDGSSVSHVELKTVEKVMIRVYGTLELRMLPNYT